MWSQVLILASRFALLRIAAFGGGADVIGPYEGHPGFTIKRPRRNSAPLRGASELQLQPLSLACPRYLRRLSKYSEVFGEG